MVFCCAAAAKPAFVSRMIPHPHTQSPDFNHSEWSMARMMQFQESVGTKIYNLMPILTSLYMINVIVSLGDDKNLTLEMGMDTGSSLSWIKCDPAKYDPRNSPFKTEPLDCRCCDHFPIAAGCQDIVKPPGCHTRLHYYSGQNVSLKLWYDRLSFQPMNYSVPQPYAVSTFDSILFGCVITLSESFDYPRLDGILGFGWGPSSIVSQIEVTQFSHCIGELTSDPPRGSIGDVLVVGDDDYMHSLINPPPESTPYSDSDHHYSVSLVGISFMGERIIEVADGQRDTYIDLGSTLSSIQPPLYDALFAKIDSWMKAFDLPPGIRDGKRVCYQGLLEDFMDEFPMVSFHFADNTTLALDEKNLFMEVSVPPRVCLNLVEPGINTTYPFNLVGQTLQKNQYIKYDLTNKRISMFSVDCAALTG